jgi:hypothetical protein
MKTPFKSRGYATRAAKPLSQAPGGRLAFNFDARKLAQKAASGPSKTLQLNPTSQTEKFTHNSQIQAVGKG